MHTYYLYQKADDPRSPTKSDKRPAPRLVIPQKQARCSQQYAGGERKHLLLVRGAQSYQPYSVEAQQQTRAEEIALFKKPA